MPRTSVATREIVAALTLPEIESILATVVEIGNDIARALKDGFQITDLVVLWGDITALRRIGPKARPAIIAFRKMTPAERGAILGAIARQFSLPDNAAAEERVKTFVLLVERSYMFLAVTGENLVKDWRAAIQKRK